MDRRVKGLSRLRASEGLRSLVRETRVGVDDLIAPLFVHHEAGWRQAIGSMPGQYQLGVEEAAEQARQWQELGLRAVLLFGLPAMKDAEGSASWDDEGGVIQRALRAIRQAAPEMVCITDVCFCEYTDHGHCGVLTERGGKRVLDHAATRANLAKQALSHARAGADMVAPSGTGGVGRGGSVWGGDYGVFGEVCVGFLWAFSGGGGGGATIWGQAQLSDGCGQWGGGAAGGVRGR